MMPGESMPEPDVAVAAEVGALEPAVVILLDVGPSRWAKYDCRDGSLG